MNFKKVYELCMKKSNNATLNSRYNIINKLIGKFNIKYFNSINILNVFTRLDISQYECGYAIANEKLLAIVKDAKSSDLNIKKYFKSNSSTLFDIILGRKVSISSAVKFCNRNGYATNECFDIVSKKRNHSLEVKKSVKNYIKKVFDFAIEIGIIEKNPADVRFIFTNRLNLKNDILTKKEANSFVKAIFNYKTLKTKVAVLLFIVLKFDVDAISKLRVNNLDFEKSEISISRKKIKVNKFINDMLERYCLYSDSSEFLLLNRTNKISSKTLNTYVYRIGGKSISANVNINILKQNYKVVLESIEDYCKSQEYEYVDVKPYGIESVEDCNDLNEFLRLRRKNNEHNNY